MKKEQKNSPNLRFKGFTEDWELCKLGDVFEQTSTLIDPKKDRLELWSLTVENGLTPKTQRYNREFLVKKNDQFKAVHSNEFLYNPMNMTLGAVDLNTTGQAVAVSGYYITMQTKENFSSKYFNIWLKTPLAIKNYKLYATGSLIERQRIQFPTLIQIKAYTPQIIEQEKIGDFFQKFDAIITLHQRKLDQLKELKKAYLQVMFPAKDERVPKLRFADFEGEWEQCKLGNILTERNTQQSKSKEYPLVSFTVEDGVTPKTERYEREQLVRGDKSSKKYKVTELNDIVYNPANLKFGAIARNHYGKAVFSPIYITFIVNDKLACSSYVEVFITRKDFISYSLKYQQGTVYERQSVSPENLLNMKFLLPNTKEQEFIGHFFEKLDCNSNFHKKKITQLKNLKKSYLQNMFI
ncbi:restriction endonuclease subunit S [Enterococcus faecalis]|uniref:restriction endonuclease subunit S n=2 Tax=Enterococcus faecalis TaxID=1351 RepID=UPI000CF2ADCC|nr:restriction endonuclease subunit S [Enterococcus faecalis]EGO8436853.1 restriction endonuclease subunit S [Enterococcus faecalis]EGO8546160.1 restriction endonuclease subunit S [Enterococcus faecalis]EGO9374966.1 restriction endonuclease subunit S [Enterococcus faecalis]EGO9493439.1 restriction endonuclease subunit S [Enterococcus faecalis]EHK9434840.1 restriction endonuclease subunit S [Enterococcus faecalis]